MSDAAPPDGTDPRVLVPDEDEPTVWVVASDSSSSRAYHTHPNRCDKINRVTNTRAVKQSIAEWQGNELCDRCAELDDAPGDLPDVLVRARTRDSRTQISAAVCAGLRKAILRGYTNADAAAAADLSRATTYPHVRGECEHDVTEPAFAYSDGEWVVRDE